MPRTLNQRTTFNIKLHHMAVTFLILSIAAWKSADMYDRILVVFVLVAFISEITFKRSSL